jgi:hypothetical protein
VRIAKVKRTHGRSRSGGMTSNGSSRNRLKERSVDWIDLRIMTSGGLLRTR